MSTAPLSLQEANWPDDGSATGPGRRLPPRGAGGGHRRLTILMTEPDPDRYRAARRVLATAGHCTIAFGNEKSAALRLARFVRPDLAILDVDEQPPVRLARALVRGLLCPVLFLAPGPARFSRQDLGFPALALAKPYDPAALAGAALRALEFFWARRLAEPLPAGLSIS